MVLYEAHGVEEEIERSQLDVELKMVNEYLKHEATQSSPSNTQILSVSYTTNNTASNTV
jgi:hypothetical protein